MSNELPYQLLHCSDQELETYRKVWDTTAIICYTDTDGLITYVNERYLETCGYAKNELLGKKLRDFIDDGENDYTTNSDCITQLNAGSEWKGVLKKAHKDGSVYWEEIMAYPFKGQDGKVEKHMHLGSDITSFKKAEAIKNQFLANVSHELRTPLHSIISLSKLFYETPLNSEQNLFLENINNSGKLLLRMVEDMLDLNKIETGHLKIDHKVFNPKNVVENLIKLFDSRFKEKGLKFSWYYDSNNPEFVYGDPFRLKQILLHLLENAITYTQQGEIKLSCRVLEKKQDTYLFEFSVRDTGIGIDANQLLRIQDKFVQVNYDHTRTYGGPGIGLNLVKQIIDLLNGTFQIESQLNKGTIVDVLLPFNAAEQKDNMDENNEALDRNQQQRHIRILIAEDVAINQLVIKKHMQKFGFDADFAENGKIALEKLKKGSYDIVLMDMQMPVMDGYEAIEIIRKEFPEPLRHTPIISITASVMGQAAKQCLEVGANDYIPKPYNVTELKEKIEKHIDVFRTKYSQTMENSSANAQTNSYIDLSYLHQLGEGDKDFNTEMISYFIDNAPISLKEMEDFCHQKDWKSLRNVAHKFKPQLTFMGIKSIFNDVENIEQFANKEKNLDEIPALIEKTKKVCLPALEELKIELEHLLDNN